MEEFSRLPDEELIRRFLREDDNEYIRIFIDRHKKFINNNIKAILIYNRIYGPDGEETIDNIFQHVIIEMLKILKIDLTNINEDLDGWLRRITRRVAQRIARKIKRENETVLQLNYDEISLIEQIPDIGQDPSETIVSQELLDTLECFIESLGKKNPKHKKIFDMYYKEGYKAKEVANCVGLTEGSIRSVLNRLKEELISFLEKKGLP